MNKNPQIDNYLLEGCGRCSLGGTPECKVHRWNAELNLLRDLVRDCGLTEERKWGVPCYSIDGKNVLIVAAFKEFCSINFFKGALLKDQKGLLVKIGENTQAGRLLKFTSLEKVVAIEKEIQEYVKEAVSIEKAGVKFEYKKHPEPIPEELESRFEEDPVFKSAFEALTPGRQRGYLLFFSAPKQSKTREERIEKHMENILCGKGIHDDYKAQRKG